MGRTPARIASEMETAAGLSGVLESPGLAAAFARQALKREKTLIRALAESGPVEHGDRTYRLGLDGSFRASVRVD